MHLPIQSAPVHRTVTGVPSAEQAGVEQSVFSFGHPFAGVEQSVYSLSFPFAGEGDE
ncbi:hypothetical protein MTP10_41645 [Nonomuraea sp. 3-1Str]|uniref:hypothetical protein n=1 Tax=Nonomuraea sp. 3-1Str TaxID=2929801 RepID=UPI002856154C|nr:hypothetical protein [Nonomuraea sp. 3-1Str]MDR8415225.1 hypothetical protein [Nonomuraea sp. 3-1Str]